MICPKSLQLFAVADLRFGIMRDGKNGARGTDAVSCGTASAEAERQVRRKTPGSRNAPNATDAA